MTSPTDGPPVRPYVPRRLDGGAARARRRGGKVLRWVAGVMAVLVLVTAGTLWFAFRHYDGQISRIAIPGVDGVPKPAKAPRDAQNFLLVGSDSREGSNAEGTQGTGESFVTGERSDTVILVHLFGSSSRVALVSFPRDSWVEIPTYRNPKTGKTTPAHHAKLNSAFSLGGPALLIATIEHLSDIRIDHYLQIDFTGFKGMVNALGGVDVCLTKPAKDKLSGINLRAGHHHINGDVALAFVRQRHGLAGGDIDRIARQQQAIGSMAKKVLSAGTLLDPRKLTGFLDIATRSLKVDEKMKANDLATLARRARAFQAKGVLLTTVPIANPNGRVGKASVVLLDESKGVAFFDALRLDKAPGEVLPPTPSPTASASPLPVVAPQDIHVAVFNSSGISGLAKTKAAELAAMGFVIEGPARTRGSGATVTKIRYGPTQSDAARTLAAALPGAVLEANPALDSTLEVLIGAPPAEPTVKPTAKPTVSPPPVKTAEQNPCTR